MKVEAKNLKIDSIFKKGKFNIPDYQREYDWEISHVDQLLYDINNNELNYFIGHMVFQGIFSGNSFEVIDGQQRITTIVIILSALRDVLYEIDEINLALGLNNYIFSKDLDNKEFVILTSDMPYPIFQKYIQSLPEKKDKTISPNNEGEKKIINIYNHVYDKLLILSLDKLKIFRDKILNLEVIFVSVEEGDAFSIFSTLNATGKDLTPLDLIKNQIFKNYPKESHLNEPHDTWKNLLANIKDQKKFLNYFWSSKYKKVSDGKIYTEFKKEIIDKGLNIKSFLKDIYNDSENFQLITNPQESDWKSDELQIYFSLNALNIFSIKVTNSILISLIRSYKNKIVDKKGLIKALSVIEKFHFLNNAISSLRSSGLDTMYSKYAKQIFESNTKQDVNIVINKLKQQLEEKVPGIIDYYNSTFEQKTIFTNNNTKNKRLINYILRKIELEKQNYNISIHDMSLEHILPQSTGNDFIIGNIGNIVLLDSNLNSSIGNNNYLNKKSRILTKSNIISTKEVFEKYNVFDDVSIKERTNFLKEYMLNGIW